MLQKAGAREFEAHVSFVDPHIGSIVGGQTVVTAERIVIATGSTPFKADIPGADLAGITDDLFYLPATPGPHRDRRRRLQRDRIRLHLRGASAPRCISSTASPCPCAASTATCAMAARRSHGRPDGIHLHHGAYPDAYPAPRGRPASERRVHLSDTSDILVDYAVLTTGRVPNLHGLNLEASGRRC